MSDKEPKFSEGFTEDMKAIIKDCIEHNALGLRVQLGPEVAVAIHIMDFPGYMKDGEQIDLDLEEPEDEPLIQSVH